MTLLCASLSDLDIERPGQGDDVPRPTIHNSRIERMRPSIRFLDEKLITRIIDEARDLLRTLGVTIHNKEVLSVLGDHGAEVDLAAEHVKLTDEMIDESLKTSPSSFHLYDVLGKQTHDFSGDNVHYTPGSTAVPCPSPFRP